MMFNPFFTTKPTGEGTVLGLSMAHEIIVKQHGSCLRPRLLCFFGFAIPLP